MKNEVSIDRAGYIYWNGSPINLVVLRQYLDQTQAMDPDSRASSSPHA